MNENPTLESAKRLGRVGVATLASVGAMHISPDTANLWALLLTPALSALGKFLRTKWPAQLGWLPF